MHYLEPEDISKTTANNFWKIKCFCGNIFIARPGHLQHGDTKSCGCIRSKNSRKNILEIHKNHRINRGYDPNCYISKITDFVRDSIFSEVRPLIFKLDCYTCNLCLQKGGSLTVHHIIPLNMILSYNDIKDFKLVYDTDNLITLCETCHKKAHSENSWSIDIDIQEDLQNIVSMRYINKDFKIEYNNIVKRIEKRIQDFMDNVNV